MLAENSTDAAFERFVGPMRKWFNDPPGADSSGFFADLAGDLAPYTEYQLELAASSIRRTRKERYFPTIRECIDACEKMPAAPAHQAQLTAGKKTYRERELDQQDEWRRRKEAERLCRCEMGRQADREMWLTALLEFAAEHLRLPERGEIADVKDLAERCNERVHILWQNVQRATTKEAMNDARVWAESIEKLRKAMHDAATRAVFGGMK